VNISLVCGGLTNVSTNVAVGARYDGVAFGGATKAFDYALDTWLTRAVDLGMIGSALGQLFPIDLRQYHMEDRLKARTLLLVGMGEPGRFAQDSLQFIMSNVIVAIKAMGETEFAIPLLGIRRKELAIGQAVRGFIQGIDDGYERFKAIAENATLLKVGLSMLAHQPLSIMLVHPDKEKLKQIGEELEATRAEAGRSNLALSIRKADPVAADPEIDSATADAGPDSSVTYLRITRSKPAAAAAVVPDGSAVPTRRKKVSAPKAADFFPTDVFQFSAMSEVAVVPQREQRVNARLTGEIASRMANTELQKDPKLNDALLMRERQGYCFTKLMIPDDFQKLIDGPADVTLELDETTAAYPWEMAASRKLTGAVFLGTNVAVSRQFRTLLSPPPTSPPPLNNTINALIIADPAAGGAALKGARDEAEAVINVLQRAQDCWQSEYVIKATVRVGSCGDPDTGLLNRLRDTSKYSIVQSAGCCDPVDLTTLLMNDQYDLIHYAGHGVCDPATGQNGWLFGPNYVLSAKDIFRVRQVPRLVFANACFSSLTEDHREQRKYMATMAQAFFARGIPQLHRGRLEGRR
jgi:hypothetical protein